MVMSPRNYSLLGISFVFVGLIFALCDRWQRQLTIEGVRTRKAHKFDHLFVMWTLRQLLQLGLFFVWKIKENNWFGLARCCKRQQDDRGARSGIARVQDTTQLTEGNVNAVQQDILLFPEVNVITGGQDIAHLLAENEEPDEHEVNDNQNLIAGLPEGDNQETAENNAVQQPQEGEVQRRRRSKKPSKLIYFPPAFFAMADVLLLYFGLKLTYSSSFIMLKGSVAFFTALLSLAFLARQLACCVWFGVIVATLGFVMSGISDYVYVPSTGYEKYGIAAGDLLILMSQIMFATKIIYEEKFIQKHSIDPLLFLGCEGMYGSFFAVTFLLLFNFVDAVQYSNLPNGRLEDIHDFLLQFAKSWEAMIAVLGSLASYILYTYLGMFLIREKGALPRIMIETFVWSIYWAVCLSLHWEHFFIVQVPGFCVITIGTLIFLIMPFSSRFQNTASNELHLVNNQIENRDDNQQIHEQNRPVAEFENLFQDNVDDNFIDGDNEPLIPEANFNEADALRRRGRETV